MSRTLDALTVGAVAAWSYYLLYVLWLTAHFNADFPYGDVMLGMLIPVGMLVVALWLRFWLAARLRNWLPRLGSSSHSGRRLPLFGVSPPAKSVGRPPRISIGWNLERSSSLPTFPSVIILDHRGRFA